MRSRAILPDITRTSVSRRSSLLFLALPLCAVGMSSTAEAAHLANHLVITEVGFDTTNETAPNSSEYIEIYNPTNSAVTLNAGAVPGTSGSVGSYFISDLMTGYYNQATGKLALGTAGNKFAFQFPKDAIIPAHGVVVVAADGAAFVNEFYGGVLANFTNLPGSPQLFETTQNGTGITDMIPAGLNGSSVSVPLNLTNGSESAVLYYWDGSSPLIKDVDVVVWGATTTNVPNKTGKSVTFNTVTATYLADAGQTTSLSAGTPGTNLYSFNRVNIDEPNETDSGGNGITGQDETSEYWGLVSAVANTTWVYGLHSPGMPLLRADTSASDGLSFLTPVAVSAADGPGGTGNPTDYGDAGSLSELYLSSIDTNGDRLLDGLYVMVRGALFGATNSSDSNTELVMIDVDPGANTGYTILGGPSSQLTDTTGTLDAQISRAGFTYNSDFTASKNGVDAVLGLDSSITTSSDTDGWRTFGTGGTLGTSSNFYYHNEVAAQTYYMSTTVGFDGNVSTLYPAATGTGFKGTDAFEGVISYANLTTSAQPLYIQVVAATTAGDNANASPNTLPESANDAFNFPQIIDQAACFATASSTAVVYYVDADKDGVGSSKISTYCGAPTAGVATKSGDCDDTKGAVYPGATEICDSLDNNCNSQIDEGVKNTYYADTDGDGFGNSASSTQGCTAPSGYVANATDCDDTNKNTYPGASETCDGKDNNCNSQIDEGVKGTYYADADSDGYGNSASSTQACTTPSGYVSNSTDCDDTTNKTYPGATELCDSKDNDCDSQIDEGVGPTWYKDADGDAHGNASQTTVACTAPSGYVSSSDDCNDSDAVIYPGATEICDGKDNNCNGQTDEAGQSTFYQDSDGDGHGNPSVSKTACGAPTGYVTSSDDCNDADAAIYTGATETCDGKDNDCDTLTDEGVSKTFYKDGDGDGHGNASFPTSACTAPSGYVTTSDDCNDADNSIYPGASEICDGKDNNCNSSVDEGVTTTWYRDFDGDAHGGATPTAQACTKPTGYVAVADDCNDADAAIYPGATELCDAKDNNCNSQIDEGVKTTYYQDSDKDGHGNKSATSAACSQPSGYVTSSDDCNDTDKTIYPGAVETCDGKDNNCDLTIDEGVKTTYYKDADSDGHGDSKSTTQACTLPTGYVSSSDDCNDADKAIYTGATEVCDAKDNDCDGATDEGVKTTYYLDADSDGHGDPKSVTQGCTAPSGYVTSSDDCNDADKVIYGGAPELCDGKDNDCDGVVDGGAKTLYYQDADGDGHGNPAVSVEACSATSGYVLSKDDCDDADDTTYTGATEACDGKDNDCNGAVPANEADGDSDGVRTCAGDCDDTDATVYTGALELCDGKDTDCDAGTDENVDQDGDGFAVCPDSSGRSDCDESDKTINPDAAEVCDGIDNDCNADTDEEVDGDGDGVSICQDDCNDESNTVYPNAEELCNEIDDNCDGSTDEGFKRDGDLDGYTNSDCGGDDCDDFNTDIHPDATDVPNDNIDQDCSGGDAIDADGDGYTTPEDCNDNDATVHPGKEATEFCDDEVDNDCDGLTDAEDADCATTITDTDGDGLYDSQEDALGTDPHKADTDDDGLDDGEEVNTYHTDPLEPDSDGDDLEDGEEIDVTLTDPSKADTDGDTLNDGAEVNTYHSDPNKVDTDSDTLNDGDEVNTHHTDPTKADTDGGGVDDGAEITAGTNPLDASDDVTGDDDDATSGDDDATSGDDDATSGDDDATSGDDDATHSGDDDASPGGDDDATGSGDDSSSSCQCSTQEGELPVPAGTILLGLGVAAVMGLRRRRQ